MPRPKSKIVIPSDWSAERRRMLEKAARDPRQMELPFRDNKPKQPNAEDQKIEACSAPDGITASSV
jgi:hypothetical protein